MVLHSIENKNAIFFPSRTVKTSDVEEFISENIALVLLLVGCRERSSFHNQCHVNDVSDSCNYEETVVH